MKQIMDLDAAILALLKKNGYEHDSRFRHWAKFVDSVDASKSNGYCFVGDFVKAGTIEVELKNRVILAAVVSGSMKYHTTSYVTVLMNADGSLMIADEATTTDKTSGWALRLRDKIAAYLIADAAEATPVTITLTGKALELLAVIRARSPMLTDDEIVTGALNLYEMHFRQQEHTNA